MHSRSSAYVCSHAVLSGTAKFSRYVCRRRRCMDTHAGTIEVFQCFTTFPCGYTFDCWNFHKVGHLTEFSKSPVAGAKDQDRRVSSHCRNRSA